MNLVCFSLVGLLWTGLAPLATRNFPPQKRDGTILLDGHCDIVTDLAFSPDGKTLASVAFNPTDKVIQLWDMPAGKLRATLCGHTRNIYGIAFSPDGKQLASASGDRTIVLWDVATGRKALTIKCPDEDDFFSDLAWSSDGKRLAVAGFIGGGKVRFWDLENNKLIATQPAHGLGVETIVSSRDGALFAVACGNGQVRIWDAATGKDRGTLGKAAMSRLEAKPVVAMAFLPGDKELLTITSDAQLQRWDVKTAVGKETPLKNAGSRRAAFSPDGRTVATGDAKGNVRLWECATGTLLATFTEHTTSDLNGKRYQGIKIIRGEKLETPSVSVLAFSPDGKYLASGSVDQLIYVNKIPELKGK